MKNTNTKAIIFDWGRTLHDPAFETGTPTYTIDTIKTLLSLI